MVSGNYNYQHIDWSHDEIPGEEFKHLGNLVTNIITPTITVGLSDYVNISFQQAIGIRSMDWMGSDDSNHHRDEDSLDSFINAIGSAFGDASVNLKYLLVNAGMGTGSRIFVGTGIIIPSNSVLTESPFNTNDDGTAANEHRHFSLSDGVYKTNFELQYYIKRKSNNWFEPAFYGLTLNYIKPLKESDYGYLPGSTYIGIGSFLFATKAKKIWIPKGLSFGFVYLKSEKAFWNDTVVNNSNIEAVIPSFGMIWNHDKYGSFSLNIRYNNKEAIIDDTLNNESSSLEISLGYRKTLSYSIPWLYFN